MKIVVLGGGGFIGGHLISRLKKENNYVIGVDLHHPEFGESEADEFIIGDLRDPKVCEDVLSTQPEEVYQLAADMGGAGYIFSGENDFNVMHNSGLINLNVCHSAIKHNITRLFYSSSACIYPKINQIDPSNPNCEESTAYPADPDSEYGWEKLFSERLYLSAFRNYGLKASIARFHNVYGPKGTFDGGKEKAPAALCRKVIKAQEGQIEVWGDGTQTRSFLYIDDCIDGVIKLMRSGKIGPYNIGSEEKITIQELAQKAIAYSNKELSIRNIDGPVGVMGRNSENTLVQHELGWKPYTSIDEGLAKTFDWILGQVKSESK